MFIPGDQTTRTDRAQSAVLGFALVFAVMIATTTMVVVFGTQSTTAVQEEIDLQRSEKVLTQLDSKAAMVALGESKVQSVDLSRASAEGYEIDDSAGHVKIIHEKGGTTTTLVDTDLGELRYNQSGTTMAYQGGGVWRLTDNGSTMISPPEYHYRNATLTFPVIKVDGDSSVSNRANLKRTSHSDVGTSNPLDGGTVTVKITSDYYKAWGEFFETRTDGAVEYDHANDRVIADLVVPANYPSLSSGLVSGNPAATLEVDNNGVVDSYNSSTGAYSGGSSNAKITVAGDLVIQKGEVYGNVEVGKTVDFDHSNAKLYDGNISYGDTIETKDSLSDHWDTSSSIYWKNDNASVAETDSVSGVIDRKESELSSSSENDNDDEDTIDSNAIDCSGGDDCEITAGAYYLTSMDVSSDTLELDTTDGDITIVVDGTPQITGEIEIHGPNRVNLYVVEDFEFQTNDALIDTDDPSLADNEDESTQFWVYMHPDKEVRFDNQFTFKGVIYGPGDGPNSGVNYDFGSNPNNAEVYGALVGDSIVVNNFEVHYDSALANSETVVQGSKSAEVTYVHISTNTISITE